MVKDGKRETYYHTDYIEELIANKTISVGE
jgi:hypothetical protein